MNDKWKAAFDQIHAEEALKVHTKEYLSEKIYSRKAAPRPVFRHAVSIAAGLVLLSVSTSILRWNWVSTVLTVSSQ